MQTSCSERFLMSFAWEETHSLLVPSHGSLIAHQHSMLRWKWSLNLGISIRLQICCWWNHKHCEGSNDGRVELLEIWVWCAGGLPSGSDSSSDGEAENAQDNEDRWASPNVGCKIKSLGTGPAPCIKRLLSIYEDKACCSIRQSCSACNASMQTY